MYIVVLYVCSKVLLLLILLLFLFIIILFIFLFGYFVVLLWNVVTPYCRQVAIWCSFFFNFLVKCILFKRNTCG